MRPLIKGVVFALAALFALTGQTKNAAAFHSGSSAECTECHRGRNGALRGSDSGSVCLRCHQAPPGTTRPRGHYVATNEADLREGLPPTQMTPGGDFAYLRKDYAWTLSGRRMRFSPGDRHGHNIVALDYGYAADRAHAFAPGSEYPAGALSCTSCHDPHARIRRGVNGAGSYRMLGGVGYEPGSAKGTAFIFPAPVAVAPDEYNRSETETDTRVAYGEGMSEWCTNCHTHIGADAGASTYGHPTGRHAKFSMITGANYNAYVKSGSLNGSRDNAYSSLVPFEEGIDALPLLAQHAKSDGSVMSGPDFNSQVMCLTCHRAHASAWDYMTRWNMTASFIVHQGRYPGVDNSVPAEYAQGRTALETQGAFYGRSSTRFAEYQRGLCNKCHARD
jgi:hypothetical protein